MAINTIKAVRELGLNPKWEETLKDAMAECKKPRRDGAPCFYCSSCYKRWSAERRNGIGHDQAVDAMMIMFEETGRE